MFNLCKLCITNFNIGCNCIKRKKKKKEKKRKKKKKACISILRESSIKWKIFSYRWLCGVFFGTSPLRLQCLPLPFPSPPIAPCPTVMALDVSLTDLHCEGSDHCWLCSAPGRGTALVGSCGRLVHVDGCGSAELWQVGTRGWMWQCRAVAGWYTWMDVAVQSCGRLVHVDGCGSAELWQVGTRGWMWQCRAVAGWYTWMDVAVQSCGRLVHVDGCGSAELWQVGTCLDSDRTRGNGLQLRQVRLGWVLGGSFSPRGGDALNRLPKEGWMPHPCRHSRPGWMRLWAAWAAGWCPCTQQGVGADGHCGPFQPRPCYESMIIWVLMVPLRVLTAPYKSL
ncbi:uncharacterized protein LOC121107588 isoform X2 [Gallus gallus]|uniref:uncharacterized protein LOC121107588 isoform X2 n=1 Tax=Gallus gallus TaxID=9031 RepID=UPI001AE852F4|nr:uncharacterized protein LOC121107588 isoform X2 [Gallus gallus]